MDDLFDNPMIKIAQKSMKPDDLEEYKKIGEYMYNNIDYKNTQIGSKPHEPTNFNLACYALEAVKAGLNPQDLSEQELVALAETYGDKWYEKYDFTEDDIPKTNILDKIFRDAENKIKNLKISRQERREIERKMKKDHKKLLQNKLLK